MKLQLALLLIILGFTRSSEVADTNEGTNTNEINDVDNISTRIFGGTTAARDQYLFVARLAIRFSTGTTTVCSGVVLTTKIILTVAHCVVRPGGELAISVTATLPRGGRYSFRRDEIIPNPIFNGVYGADTAILKKNTPLTTFMRNFGTVPSIQPDTPTTGNNAIIVGWGRTTGNKLYSRKLQFANVVIMDPNECSMEYSELADSMSPNELICTYNNIAGICAGDWGGPLLVEDGNRQVLKGLHMFRRGECTNLNPLPSAYYNIEVAVEWLLNIPELSSLININ